nr:MAG TPA: hypothetical protein [Caudoviricetes sp.]
MFDSYMLYTETKFLLIAYGINLYKCCKFNMFSL